jgi:RIO kinase 2
MSSAEEAVQVYKQLEVEDFRILHIIESAMSKREFVPKEQIKKYAELPMDRIEYTLSKLNKLNLIFQKSGAYVGHTLNYIGYDCLAINTLVKAGVISAFGHTIGVGKEADVYEALTPQDVRIAVKFHRLGRISFRQTRRLRSYTAEHAGWLYQSHLAAEKEFEALKLVYAQGVAVPKPISHNRHVIAMGMIEGAELSKYKDVGDAKKVLKEIYLNVKKSYLKAHVIHGDLSDYNIILKPDGHVLIIDWPQYVPTTHPNASDMLERDIKNVADYFSRKYSVKVDLKEVYQYATGKIGRLKF